MVAQRVDWQSAWAPSVRVRSVIARKRVYARPAIRIALSVVWLLALGAAAALYTSGLAFQSPVAISGLGAALGGAGGNFLDIVRNHGVTDFIGVGWWPAFNLADVAILAGLALAFWPT